MAIRDLLIKIGVKSDDAALKRFDAGLKDLSSSAARLGRQLAIIGAASAAAFGFVLKKAGEFEQTQIAFEVMLGSAEKATKLLADLSNFAATTPFRIEGVERNAKLLLAVGIESDKLIGTMKSLGDVSAGLNVPMQRLALNYGQVKTQGKLTGRELRDFAVAGVPLLAELAKNLGTTKNVITDMVSAGKIGFKDVEKAFISMTTRGGDFANLMERQSKTFLGTLSNIADTFSIVLRDSGLEAIKILQPVVSGFQKWMEINEKIMKSKLKSFLSSVATAIKDIINAVGGLQNALMIVGGLFAIFTAGTLIVSLAAVLTALKAISTTMLLIGAKIALVLVAFSALALIMEDIWFFMTDEKALTITGKLLDMFKDRFPNAFKVLKTVAKAVFGFITRALFVFWNQLKVVAGFFKGVFTGNWDLLTESIRNLKFVFKDTFKLILDTLKKVADLVSNSFVGEFFKKSFDFVAGKIGSITSAPISSPISNMSSNVTNNNSGRNNITVNVNGSTNDKMLGEQIAAEISYSIAQSTR